MKSRNVLLSSFQHHTCLLFLLQEDTEMLTRYNHQGKRQLPALCWGRRPSAKIHAFWQAGLKTPGSSGSRGHYTAAWSETLRQGVLKWFTTLDQQWSAYSLTHASVTGAPLTCVLSHCLSTALTASRTLSWPSSTCRLLRAIDAGGLDGEATTPGLSISFTFLEMCTSCMHLTEYQTISCSA